MAYRGLICDVAGVVYFKNYQYCHRVGYFTRREKGERPEGSGFLGFVLENSESVAPVFRLDGPSGPMRLDIRSLQVAVWISGETADRE